MGKFAKIKSCDCGRNHEMIINIDKIVFIREFISVNSHKEYYISFCDGDKSKCVMISKDIYRKLKDLLLGEEIIND